MDEKHWTKDTPLTWKAWAMRALLLALYGLWVWWLDDTEVAIGVTVTGYVIWATWSLVRLRRRLREMR